MNPQTENLREGLIKAIDENNIKAVKSFLENHPDSVKFDDCLLWEFAILKDNTIIMAMLIRAMTKGNSRVKSYDEIEKMEPRSVSENDKVSSMWDDILSKAVSSAIDKRMAGLTGGISGHVFVSGPEILRDSLKKHKLMFFKRPENADMAAFLSSVKIVQEGEPGEEMVDSLNKTLIEQREQEFKRGLITELEYGLCSTLGKDYKSVLSLESLKKAIAVADVEFVELVVRHNSIIVDPKDGTLWKLAVENAEEKGIKSIVIMALLIRAVMLNSPRVSFLPSSDPPPPQALLKYEHYSHMWEDLFQVRERMIKNEETKSFKDMLGALTAGQCTPS